MKGYFKPKNIKKYRGDPTDIIYRSSYELKFMCELDNDPNVISWGSETVIIPYRSPLDNKIHRYFVDFVVTKNNNGKKEIMLIEVKPLNQTKQPVRKGKMNKKFINETMTYSVNQAKWEAATSFCENRGWKFYIYTEQQLNIPTWKKK